MNNPQNHILTPEESAELLERAKLFFKEQVVTSHVKKGLKKATKLDKYNINPFLYKYLANFLKGDDSPRSIAEALIYPRILGSSINTSFGMQIQKLISVMFSGFGSAIQGIDIEFIDAVDNRRKYCQLKSGPNTINHDDVETIIGHFRGIQGVARTNNLPIAFNDLIVGVIYGEPRELNSHYQRLQTSFPVIIGKDFWHRLTGDVDFYFKLIDAVGEVAIEVDASSALSDAIENLANQIEQKLSED